MVRVVFIVISLATGISFGAYPLAWVLIPAATAGALGYGRRPWRERFSAWREVIALVLLVGAGVLVLRRAGLWLGDVVVVPLVLATCGVALILRQTGPAPAPLGERLPPARVTTPGSGSDPGWRRWPGGVLGIALVLTAALLFLGTSGILPQSRHAIGAMIVILIAIGLVFGPWFAGLARSLASERSERIRSQERSDLAAHLHDSVLQTLALIQRRADDPREVAGLARRQERELRHWLLARTDAAGAAPLRAALEQAAADIEDLYKVRVETVTVGDGVQHASNAQYGPAGGAAGYCHALEIIGIFVGPLAAVLIGAEAGAGDSASGVFRDLVVTGRPRAALFAVRIPGALLLCLPVIGLGYLVGVAGTFLLAGGTPTPSAATLLNGLGWAWLVDGTVCVVAVGLASLTNSRPATITSLIGFELVASPVLLQQSSLGSLRRVLLDSSVLHLTPVTDTGAPVVTESLLVALVVIAVWLLVAAGLGAYRTVKMDA